MNKYIHIHKTIDSLVQTGLILSIGSEDRISFQVPVTGVKLDILIVDPIY